MTKAIWNTRGSNLSGDHRQHITIARANTVKLRILILDETMTALEYEMENLPHNYLKRIAIGRTVLMIAHRLDTARNADMTLVTGGTCDVACAQLVRASGLGG